MAGAPRTWVIEALRPILWALVFLSLSACQSVTLASDRQAGLADYAARSGRRRSTSSMSATSAPAVPTPILNRWPPVWIRRVVIEVDSVVIPKY